jgi:hypothetical protein
MEKLELYQPIDNHQQETDLSSVVELTPPAGADSVLIQVTVAPVRFLFDGGAPSASLGFRYTADQFVFLLLGPGMTIKAIKESGSPILEIQWFNVITLLRGK